METPLGESKWGNPGPTSQGEEELLRVKGQIMCPAAYMEPSIEHTQSQISPQNTVLTLLKDAKKGLAETLEMTPEKQVWLTDYRNVPQPPLLSVSIPLQCNSAPASIKK